MFVADVSSQCLPAYSWAAQLRSERHHPTAMARWTCRVPIFWRKATSPTRHAKGFHQVTAFPTEHVQITRMRIAMQRLLHLQGKTVHPTSHIGRTRGQPDADTGRRDNHRRSTVITRRSVARPTSCPTFTDVPSGSMISILPPDTCSAPAPAACLASLPVAGSPIVRTGRNTSGGPGLSTPRRTWLRQFHSRPRLISYRRAISAMPEPGCSVYATIRSFSSRLQRRRRSTPVMISIRLAASDLSGAHTSAV